MSCHVISSNSYAIQFDCIIPTLRHLGRVIPSYLTLGVAAVTSGPKAKTTRQTPQVDTFRLHRISTYVTDMGYRHGLQNRETERQSETDGSIHFHISYGSLVLQDFSWSICHYGQFPFHVCFFRNRS